MTRLLDTHCHLDAYPDPRAVLAGAKAASVDVVAVTEHPDGYRRLRTRLGATAGVTVALGLHPASRPAAAPGQLERFLRMLPAADWIGEVGLDFTADTSRRDRLRQIAAFQAVIDHQSRAPKPMTVHSRGAADDVVTRLTMAPVRAVLHWFSGPPAAADEALAGGLWFSVNPSMTKSVKGRHLIARLPPDRVLCETDGPYCATGGWPAVPADIRGVARYLADVWQASETDAALQLAHNARAFVGAATGDDDDEDN